MTRERSLLLLAIACFIASAFLFAALVYGAAATARWRTDTNEILSERPMSLAELQRDIFSAESEPAPAAEETEPDQVEDEGDGEAEE